jgi:DNA-binding XRE family transcriptional regulator
MHRNGDLDPSRGGRLRRLREAFASTQAEFARSLGFTRAQWANYEHGEGLRPTAVNTVLGHHPGLTGTWIFTGVVRGLELAMAEQLGERKAYLDGLAADLADYAKTATGEHKTVYDKAIACLIKDGARPPSRRPRRVFIAHKVGEIVGSPAIILNSIIIWEIAEHLLGIAYAISGG